MSIILGGFNVLNVFLTIFLFLIGADNDVYLILVFETYQSLYGIEISCFSGSF